MNTTIDIDLDHKCRRCGKPGATKGGLCLPCLSKAIAAGEFDSLLKSKPAITKGENEKAQ